MQNKPQALHGTLPLLLLPGLEGETDNLSSPSSLAAITGIDTAALLSICIMEATIYTNQTQLSRTGLRAN